jgi:hypothetical protein
MIERLVVSAFFGAIILGVVATALIPVALLAGLIKWIFA